MEFFKKAIQQIGRWNKSRITGWILVLVLIIAGLIQMVGRFTRVENNAPPVSSSSVQENQANITPPTPAEPSQPTPADRPVVRFIVSIDMTTLSEPKLTDEDRVFGKIHFFMDEKEILEVLGPPQAVESDGGSYQLDIVPVTITSKDLIYPGIKFWMDSQGSEYYIRSMTITSPDYPTARGIRVGDEVEKVLLAYGKPDGTIPTLLPATLRYYFDAPDFITFDIGQDNKVHSIEMTLYYD